MARDDRFKAVQVMGAEFLETIKGRLEELASEASRASGGPAGRAHDTFEDLVESGRRGTEQLLGAVRALVSREVAQQLSALGLSGRPSAESTPARGGGSAKKACTTKKAGPAKAAAKKAAPKKKVAAEKVPAKKASARKVAQKKVAAKKAPAKRAGVGRTTGRNAPDAG